MSNDIRNEPVAYATWGEENIEPGARDQMRRAAQLPIAVQGALMPDAHEGYGLPIGGVLATQNAIIPYAVGVDIACRMRMTVFNLSPYEFEKKRDKFRKVLDENTLFGVGGHWRVPHDHAVLDDPLWDSDKFLHQRKDVAWKQLGSSGSGNHFAEFGKLVIHATFAGTGDADDEGSHTYGNMPAGTYLALLSHSGSRRVGFDIANHYTKIAMNLRDDLPKSYKHLAWLAMDSEEGQAYWHAMNLAGRYASANHAVIHQSIIGTLRLDVLGGVENHHNFAWKETHNGSEVYVHRKGATPAGDGVYGVIPGSMTAPGFVVRGKGNPLSLDSAAHGAGRRMSRKAAFNRFDWHQVDERLRELDVEVLSASLDETPGAYKNIHDVMGAQTDLVDVVAEFQPMLVKMAPGKRDRTPNRRQREKDKSQHKKKRRKNR